MSLLSRFTRGVALTMALVMLATSLPILQARAAMVTTDQVVADIEKKHPARRPSELAALAALRPVHERATARVSPETIKKAIGGFPKGSAAGNSGLRPQHLQDALAPGWQHEFLRQTAAVANQMLGGRVAESARPWKTARHSEADCGWRGTPQIGG